MVIGGGERKGDRMRTVVPRVLLRWVAWLLVFGVLILLVVWVWNSRQDLVVECGWHGVYKELSNRPQASTTQFYLDEQIIITGPTSDLKDNTKLEGDLGVEPMRSCEIQVRGSLGEGVAALRFPSRALRSLTMGLYKITDGRSVEEVLDKIEQEYADLGIHADPNYLTGLLGQSSCGKPYEIVGSADPYEIVGSPYEIVGSPSGGKGEADPVWFWNQWAFEQIGVGLFYKDAVPDAAIHATGAGVKVAVFDTSPFGPSSETENAEPEESQESVKWWTRDGVEEDFEFNVTSSNLPPLELADPQAAADVSDHGLFVAGLIHAVAPDSDIELIEVLDEHGCGDLWYLNERLMEFAREISQSPRDRKGVVINLSLGVLQPGGSIRTEPALPPNQDETDANDSEQLGSATQPEAMVAQDPVESLLAAVYFAQNQGAVVVAAAGNDSYMTARPLRPHIPAAYPWVIGVEASNIQRQRACFSNWADVSAPGGEGGPGEVPDLTTEDKSDTIESSCAPVAEHCSGNCANALVSLANSSPTKYAYWTGTSFSTPLVSGLAALIFDAGASRNLCGTTWVSPDDVFEAIRCGAPTSDGVINVPATLFRCLP